MTISRRSACAVALCLGFVCGTAAGGPPPPRAGETDAERSRVLVAWWTERNKQIVDQGSVFAYSGGNLPSAAGLAQPTKVSLVRFEDAKIGRADEMAGAIVDIEYPTGAAAAMYTSASVIARTNDAMEVRVRALFLISAMSPLMTGVSPGQSLLVGSKAFIGTEEFHREGGLQRGVLLMDPGGQRGLHARSMGGGTLRLALFFDEKRSALKELRVLGQPIALSER